MTSGGAARYAAAGVDIDAADRAIELMRAAVARTARPEVVGGIGGFCGLFDASKLAAYRRPLLATSTDGVGTKVVIAQRLGQYEAIGIDLVAMVADDLVVCGAEPLFMTDYLVFGKVVPERVAAVVAGIAAGCERAGCALIGGETAEHPGHLGPAGFDIAGAATGVVEADDLLGADRVHAGDAVIAMASSGVHANGFSLVRDILAKAGMDLEGEQPELGRTLGAELSIPSYIYTPACLALARSSLVHAFAHITGGGIAANMARVLPADADAVLDRRTWCPPPVFRLLADRAAIPGGMAGAEMERVFNLGIGMTAVVPPAEVSRVLELLAEQGVGAWVAGEILPGSGSARLTGSYPA
ncbi:MAG TPA: phosphoribosylformylglycinamidine cyclo-ligase [Streptosporangiaceae bacterium]|nr:phosphoribosylformylglycinamidine cyclo-ligase [Streptosporangiaceae bacterium]